MNDGISWNFAAAVVRSDTVGCPSRADYPLYPIEAEALANLEALVCFSDSTRRDAARRALRVLRKPCSEKRLYSRCRTVWGLKPSFEAGAVAVPVPSEALATGTRWR